MSDHHKQESDPNWKNWLIAGGIYLSCLLIIFALQPMVGFVLYAISALVVLLALIIFYFQQGELPLAAKPTTTFADRLRDRLTECERQEDKFRDEANAILRQIRALEDDLGKSSSAPAEDLERARNVITALQAEFDLRHTKALFFADCATRLRSLLDRHHLNESIKAGERELTRLQTTNYDDEAAVEEARHHLEQDSAQLEALSSISRNVDQYFNTKQAEELRLRLEKLRGKILGKSQPREDKKS